MYKCVKTKMSNFFQGNEASYALDMCSHCEYPHYCCFYFRKCVYCWRRSRVEIPVQNIGVGLGGGLQGQSCSSPAQPGYLRPALQPSSLHHSSSPPLSAASVPPPTPASSSSPRLSLRLRGAPPSDCPPRRQQGQLSD